MQTKRRAQLSLARRKRLLIRFSSVFERGTVCGYVLDIGQQFFLLALLSDGLRFNGFECFRLSDVRKLRVPDKYASFHEAVLRKRRERVPSRHSVVVTSLPKLLLSANRAFPLVTIHLEKAKPEVCFIGRVVDVRNGRVILHEIGPGADWDDQLETYRLSEITRVDFGGDYEEALHLIGGRPTALKSQ